IRVTTSDGKSISGVLVNTTDSSLTMFSGKPSEYNHLNNFTVSQQYSNITKIETHRKGSLLKGLLIGAGIGIAPVLVGNLFGPSIGEGAAYVSLITFPVGVITGGILGGTSKKIFLINGDATKFYSFHKRMKY
ncbi:MAG: hypothetical protein ABIT07_00135, partial [Ferruginibacter sp.]